MDNQQRAVAVLLGLLLLYSLLIWPLYVAAGQDLTDIRRTRIGRRAANKRQRRRESCVKLEDKVTSIIAADAGYSGPLTKRLQIAGLKIKYS